MTAPTLVRVLSQNVERGGRYDSQGRREDRWTGMAETINATEADVLLLQEMWGIGQWLRRRAVRRSLRGMRLLVAPCRAGGPTVVVAYRRDLFVLDRWETHLSHLTLRGFGTAVLRPKARPEVPLTVISAHCTPYSAPAAAEEIKIMMARAHRFRDFGIVGGDLNHFLSADAAKDPDPDWGGDGIEPTNLSGRTIPGSDPPVGDRILARVLKQGQMVDVAAHIAETRNRPELLRPTGRHGGIRVDGIAVTKPLLDAVDDCAMVDPGGSSDHWGVMADLRVERVDPERGRVAH